jgi:hypothetical protein
MAVNTLMTGLIVFKILKAFKFLEFNKPTSVERTLSSLSSTGGSKLRHILFIIIESGMALFAIQLVRVVLSILVLQIVQNGFAGFAPPLVGLEFVIGIHEMLNVIIMRSIHFYFFCFTNDIYLGIIRASHQQ